MEKRVVSILKKRGSLGMSITDLVKTTGISRSVLRTILARLEGARKVSFRNVGMAKVYWLLK